MGWTARPGSMVTDTGNVRFTLTRVLARGGQGEVWLTEAEGAAIKISTRPNVGLPGRIEAVARLPIHDLPVAAPRRTLQPPAFGYSMSLITGMMPIGGLGPVGYGEIVSSGDIPEWYVATGALRKRLAVLARLADVLAVLHSRGLVYGDLSAANVLVSEAPARSRVFLIDLDNVRMTDEPAPGAYTVRYAAPEQPDQGASQASDRFSLALLGISILTARNPFYGGLLNSLPAEELHTRPWAALGPWVDDPTDPRNRGGPDALDRGRMLSPLLRRLVAQAFTVGRVEGTRRPAPSLVAAAARTAQWAVTTCNCGWQNYVTAEDCHRCDTPISASYLAIWEPRADGSLVRYRSAPYVVLGEGGVDERSRAVERGPLGLGGEPDAPALVVSGDHREARLVARADELELSAGRLVGDAVAVLNRRARVPLLLRLEKAGGGP